MIVNAVFFFFFFGRSRGDARLFHNRCWFILKAVFAVLNKLHKPGSIYLFVTHINIREFLFLEESIEGKGTKQLLANGLNAKLQRRNWMKYQIEMRKFLTAI